MTHAPASTPTSAARPAHERGADRALARAITRWYARAARDLPWRRPGPRGRGPTPQPDRQLRDPWLVLVSEVMLQQTQAARVAERFDAFAAAFPTPAAMAAAPADRVVAAWSGLGYYRRARSLHACAAAIVARHGGRVPDDPRALLALPGVGRYTAGAVLAIGFGRPAPLVDANVARVALRLEGLRLPAGDPHASRASWGLMERLMGATDAPAALAEGVMELGALVCTPRKPDCARCPLASRCVAHAQGEADAIPSRPAPPRPRRGLALAAIVVADRRGRLLLERRGAEGPWAGLWQPPTVERWGCAPPPADRAIAELGLEGLVVPAGPSHASAPSVTNLRVLAHASGALARHASRVIAARRRRGADPRWLDPAGLGSLPIASAQRAMLEHARPRAHGLTGRT